jgi:hypothetical protein
MKQAFSAMWWLQRVTRTLELQAAVSDTQASYFREQLQT